jgi:hypothetical protein
VDRHRRDAGLDERDPPAVHDLVVLGGRHRDRPAEVVRDAEAHSADCRYNPLTVGAKDWMVFYAEQDVPSVLRRRPALDREATERLVERLFPGRAATALEDVSLLDGDPPDDRVHAAVWPGATVVCSGEVGVDRPSAVDPRFVEEGAGRSTYLHAMHSVVDWFAFAVWEPDGRLRRALSLSPDNGIMENAGEPLPFEEPFWSGARPADDDEDEDDPYPLPFHPLELAEEALGSLFGFVYEGPASVETIDPDDIPLAAFALKSRRRGLFGRRR